MKIIKNSFFFLSVVSLFLGGFVLAFSTGNLLPQQNNISNLAPTKGMAETLKAQSSVNFAPKTNFVVPKNNKEIKGETKIIVEVAGANNLEFYLSQGESLSPTYLGEGEFKNQEWEYVWNTNKIPNGEYYLFAQVTNQYGTYKGDKIKVKVNNVSEESNASQKRREEVENINGQIKEEDGKINQSVDQASEGITTEASIAVDSAERSIQDESASTKKEIEQAKKGIKDAVKSSVQSMSENIKTESRLQSEIKEKEQAKVKIEEKIKQKSQELQQIETIEPTETMKAKVEQIKQEKKQVLENHQLQKNKIDEDIQAKQKQLSETRKEKNKKQQEVIKNALKPIDIIQQHLNNSKSVSQLKEEASRKIQTKVSAITQQVQKREQSKIKLEQEASKDSDGDGLSDSLEIELGTDILNPDSDGDGYLDGEEVAVKSDPNKPSTKSKIVYQDPRKVQPKKEDIFTVESVRTKISEDKKKEVLVIEGKGLPNTFVTVYIYSLPIIVVTKTDAYGRWVYELDKPIESGDHEVYVVLNNNQGELTARSTGFNFIKSGANILQLVPDVWAKETAGGESRIASPYEHLQKGFILLTIAIIILAISVALLTIGFLGGKKKKNSSSKLKKIISRKNSSKKKTNRRK